MGYLLLALLSGGCTVGCMGLWYVIATDSMWPTFGPPTTADYVVLGILHLCMAAAVVVIGWVTLILLKTGWIRLTSESRQEEITLTSVEETSSTIMLPTRMGNVTILIPTTSRSTEVTCREYPGETFSSGGHRGWKEGDRIPITFWLRGEERLDYAL